MDNADRLIELFNGAKYRPTGAVRDAYLAEECGDDAAMKAQVCSLVEAHENAGEFLQARPELSPEMEATLARLKPEQAGQQIGPYKLREQIGEGGFGTVWVAEQQVPVRRTVALKIIKLGMDTEDVVARFGQERQALAMMDHPNIAKVIDAGATEWGRPFFVMELVRGIRITDFCDQANLPTDERLALFIQVCHAVQHAHQKGIIHRDIKPSNILVTLHDGVPVPKVIDFGVAKATQGRLAEHTVYTRFQQMVGTPLYMSPEQAEMNGTDIDTRTDIYALGVLLYELLTGRTPFDADTLMKAGLDEMRRVIREQEPQKPSTALHTMAQEIVTAVAHHRASEPPKLIHAIRGDLDWIVMKSLEKDRARRYDTANGLAMDLQRHLDNEPVVARPPSAGYRLQKLVRRNKLAFGAGSAVFASLLLGLGISVGMFFKEKAAHERAVAAERRTEQARAAEARLQVRIDDVMELMQSQGENFEAEKLLTEVMARAIESKPQRAHLHLLRALFLAQRGRWNAAATDFSKSLELNPETVYQSAWRCYLFGTILVQTGQLDAYREHCRRSLQLFGTTTNATSIERIAKMCLLLPSSGVDLEAVAKMTDTAVILDENGAWGQFAKGLAEYRQGHFESAAEWEQKTLRQIGGGDEDHRFVEAYMVQAMASYQLKQMDDARAALAKGVEIEQTKLPKIESGDLGRNWMDWIITHTLMREAKALIEGQPAPNAPPQPK